MKKIFKVLISFFVIGLIFTVLFVGNAIFGNPISKFIVSKNAQKYVEETYADKDYYIDRIGYDFKTNGYYVFVKSNSSIDTYFSVGYDIFGNEGNDSYTSRVLDGFNTWHRINLEYRDMVDTVIDKLRYDSDINYGEIQTIDKYSDDIVYGLNINDLELDKKYDIKDMGAKHGKIVLYIYTNEINVQNASDILLEVKEISNQNDLCFYAIDLVLRKPINDDKKEWEDRESIRIEDFLYSDILKDGLIEKINNNISNSQNLYLK